MSSTDRPREPIRRTGEDSPASVDAAGRAERAAAELAKYVAAARAGDNDIAADDGGDDEIADGDEEVVDSGSSDSVGIAGSDQHATKQPRPREDVPGRPALAPTESGRRDPSPTKSETSDETDEVPNPNAPLVAYGPRWFRAQIRRFGTPAGLIPMAAFGMIAFIALALSDTTISAAIGLLFGCAAAPVLLFFGAPFGDTQYYPLAVALSVPIWAAIGWLASRRAANTPLPEWRRYRRQLALLTGAVLVGVGIALGLASWRLGGGVLT